MMKNRRSPLHPFPLSPFHPFPLSPLLALLLVTPAQAAVIHVTLAGKAGAAGTAAAPLGRVQEALDRARPGDTVHVHAGVYRERVRFESGGEHGRPITLEGEPGAVLDGSESVPLEWQPAPDVAPGAYRAPQAFLPFTVVADGKIVTLLREDRVDPTKVADPKWHWPNLFRDGVGPSGWEGVKALALHFAGKRELLVRFQGDRDPRGMAITVAPREAGVHISGADRCVVRGLTVRNAAYGVFIEDSLGSVVEQCTLGPVDYGVWLDRGSDRCTVRFNEMFMDPYAGADPRGKGAWDNWQAHKVGGHYDRFGVQIYRTRGGHEVHDNSIHDTWDGIEDRGAPGENAGLRIHHNRLSLLQDDGLEPNGAEEDCRWHDNLVERCICGFRIKAPTVGPLYAYRNLFLDNSEDFRNFGEVEMKPATVYVYHNTCTARPAIASNKVRGIGTPNYHYLNNLFWCAYWWMNSGPSVDPNWKGEGNVFVRREKDRRWDAGRETAGRCRLDERSLWHEGDPGFADLEKRDVSLKPDSPARGRGADVSRILGRPLPGCEPGYFKGDAPDAGAVQFGSPMPRLPRRPDEVNAPAAGTWPGPEARSPNAPAGENLLANGGFERGLESWEGADAAAHRVGTGGAAEGERFLVVDATTKIAGLSRKIAGLTPGKAYVLLYRSRRCTVADLRVIVRDPVSAAYLANGTAAAGDRWRRAALHFTPRGPEVSLEISPRSAGLCELDAFLLAPAR